MLALSKALSIALLISGAVLAVVALATLFLRGRTRERGPDIPVAMRPGPSDGALETPLLLKLQGWGVLLVAFFVVWIPFVWLSEPSDNLQQEKDLKATAIDAGARTVRISPQAERKLVAWYSGSPAHRRRHGGHTKT